jgi:hypothetical protein
MWTVSGRPLPGGTGRKCNGIYWVYVDKIMVFQPK